MTTQFERGVVIGKFYPPHRGHSHLIETAIAYASQVTVIVCAKATDTIPGATRGEWLRELHPTATVMVIDDTYDENDTAVWAANTIRWLGRAPDAVFTSEGYGDPYAAAMHCTHISVDPARRAVPCSGTAIRTDPFANWDYLAPPVRAWFVQRICVLGAESTGTTTLAADLAAHYGTVWVPEYGREYSGAKFDRGDHTWASSEFAVIATEQNRQEAMAARSANRLLIGDTNSFATCLWHRRYMGHESAEVAAIAARAQCNLYLLTGDEIPFVQDGYRDGEAIRHTMHEWFVEKLQQQEVQWELLRGSREARLRSAVARIAELFRGSAWQPPG